MDTSYLVGYSIKFVLGEETGDSLFSKLDDNAKTLVQKVEDGVEDVYDEVGRDARAAYNFVKTEASCLCMSLL